MDFETLFGKGCLKNTFQCATGLFDLNSSKAELKLKAALESGVNFEGSTSYSNKAAQTFITNDGSLAAKAKVSFAHSSGLGLTAEGEFPSKGKVNASFKNLAPGLTLSAGVEATSAKKKEGSEKTSSQELSLAVVGNADFSDDSVKAQTTVRYPLGGSAAVDASVSASFEGVTVAANTEYTVGQSAPSQYNVGLAYTKDKLFFGVSTSNKLGVITSILQSKVADNVNAAVAVSYSVGSSSIPPAAVAGEYDLNKSGKIRGQISSSGDVAVAYSLKIQDAICASVGSRINFKSQKFGFGVSATYSL